MEKRIIMYGTEWCGDTRRAKKILNENQIEYEYINVDRDEESEKLVKKINNGFRSVPTIIFPDCSIIVEPTNDELKLKLIELNYIH
jgi:mycoredoxin